MRNSLKISKQKSQLKPVKEKGVQSEHSGSARSKDQDHAGPSPCAPLVNSPGHSFVSNDPKTMKIFDVDMQKSMEIPSTSKKEMTSRNDSPFKKGSPSNPSVKQQQSLTLKQDKSAPTVANKKTKATDQKGVDSDRSSKSGKVKKTKNTKSKNLKSTTTQDLNDCEVASVELKSRISRVGSVLGSIYNRQSTYRTAGGDEVTQLKLDFERLQSTIGILNGKLKSQSETEQRINQLRKQIKEMDKEKTQSDLQISELKAENTSLKNETDILNKRIEYLNSRVQDLTAEVVEHNDNKYKLDAQQADSMEQIEQLQNQLMETQEEYYNLKSTHEDLLEKSSFYIGHCNDKVDIELANYIKQFPEREKFKIMFLRESSGVYQFGQRKVYIKIEKGNQIKVRVGGGFMHIDEFLEQYTDSEIDRIERKDVVSRFKNKIKMQKASLELAKNAVEEKPIQLSQTPETPAPQVLIRTNLEEQREQRSPTATPRSMHASEFDSQHKNVMAPCQDDEMKAVFEQPEEIDTI